MYFVLSFALLTSLALAAPTKKSAPKKPVQSHAGPIEDDEDENDADKFVIPQEEHDGGDPYRRYTDGASAKDGNCDPTFLRELYDSWALATCHMSLKGSCLNVQDFHLYWASLPAIGFGYKRYSKELEQLKDRFNDLRYSPTEKLSPKDIAELEELNKKFVGQSRQLRKWTNAKLIGRGVRRGAWIGGLALSGWVFAYSDLYPQTKAFFIGEELDRGTCELDERDPNFIKYVPVVTGTCKSPLYEIGHPKVLDFLEAPFTTKMQALQNKLVCGFYKSLNAELIKRNGFEDTRSQIQKVQCDHGTGQIKFELKKNEKINDRALFTINRRKDSQEFSNYTYDRQINGVTQESATFELAQKEDDIDLILTQISGIERPIITERIPQFQKAHPAKAKSVFTDAYRTVRRFSRPLAICCDEDPPKAPTEAEMADKKKRKNVKVRLKQMADYEKLCRKEWFAEIPREPVPATPASPPAKAKR